MFEKPGVVSWSPPGLIKDVLLDFVIYIMYQAWHNLEDKKGLKFD